jgi:hypothetical protein
VTIKRATFSPPFNKKVVLLYLHIPVGGGAVLWVNRASVSMAHSGGLFTFEVPSTANETFVIETTTNLGPASTWTPLATNTGPFGSPIPSGQIANGFSARFVF